MGLSRRALLAGAGVWLPGVLAAPPARAAEWAYVGAADLDLTVLLPPPPAADSDLQRREIEQVLAAQAAADLGRVARALADSARSVEATFGAVLGPRFDSASLLQAARLFALVARSESAVTGPAKKFFGRVRPYLADGRVKVLVPPSWDGSWPSGHTTRATTFAAVLTAMLPEKRADLWARAADYAWSRVIGGMHYPLDLEAGRRAGTALAAVLFATPAFRADFPAAKAEVRQALGV